MLSMKKKMLSLIDNCITEKAHFFNFLTTLMSLRSNSFIKIDLEIKSFGSASTNFQKSFFSNIA